jgi:serine/threonine protein kinase/DNA-directed RNA polymerase specialized sigma24 family protein
MSAAPDIASQATVASEPSIEPSDAELVVLYRETRTDVAFGELIRRHQIAIFRLLLTLLGDADQAEKACEQTFFEAARKLDELADPAAFPSWLAGVARGLAQKAQAARGKKPKKTVKPKLVPAVDPRGVVKQQVQGVLGELTNDERAALVLADLEGDSYEAIAATLGTTPTDAEALVEQARTKFVAAMARRNEGEDAVTVVATVVDPELTPGRVLGKRFKIERRIGEGGMGAVYRATDLKTNQEVAVKTLLPEAAKDPALRRRFEREAKILQRIAHPNFVRFVDYGDGSGEPAYVVMEFLDGNALSKLITDESLLGPARALHITRHVLTGLKYAHGLGVIHRDMKPDNVVIVNEPEDAEFAKILDFGIARLAEAEGEGETKDKTKLTQKGEIFGTPMYMSPEQVRGDPIDPRADLYSVSVMLYEMLAARPPFVAKNPNGLFAMHLASPPPPLKDLQPNLEQLGPLQELLDVGLQKQPEERFASAEVYLEHIDALLANGFSGASSDPAAVRPKPKLAGEGSPTCSADAAIAPQKSGQAWSIFRLSARRRLLLGLALIALVAAGALLYGTMRP